MLMHRAQKENHGGLNDLMAQINDKADIAEAAINDLTEAQIQALMP